MLEKFLIWSSKAFKRPLVFVIFAVAVTVIFAFGIPRLRFDNNIKSMIPATNRDRIIDDYYEDEGRFGSSDMIFVGVRTDDVYSEKNLAYVKALKDEIEGLNNILPGQGMASLLGLGNDEGIKVIEALRGVGINEGNYKETLVPLITSAEKLESTFSWDTAFAERVAKAAARVEPSMLYVYYENPIDKTQSIVNADYIANEDDALVVKKLVEDEDLSPANIAGLKKRISSWELYKDGIVSQDGTLSMILVTLNTHDLDRKSSLGAAIEKVLKTRADPSFTSYLDGEPVIESMISRSMFADLKFLLPLVVVVVLLMLYFCFRNILGVLYPAAIILMSVIFTLGLMAFCNVPISIVSTTIPVLLVAIVSAYGIHQMNHYLLDPETGKLAILNKNMKRVGLAILLSGITVMVGFGALAVEDFVPIKDFGIFTAIGDLVGVIGALYVLPAIILTSPRPKNVFSTESTKGWVSSILHGFVRLNRKHSKVVIGVALAFGVLFLIGSFGVKTELNNVSFFKKGSAIRQADDYLNQKLAGTMVLNVVLDSDLSDPVRREGNPEIPETVEIATPAVLQQIEQFDADVRKEFPYVTKVVSFNNIVKKMNQEMNGGEAKDYVIPPSKELISQYLLIFTGDIKNVISPNHDKLRVALDMKRVPTSEVEKVRRYCVSYFSKDFLRNNHIQVQVTGTANLYNVANTLLVDGMIKSIAICIAIVFLLLIYVLRSVRMSLVAITPIIVTLLLNFGALGFFNIPLNVGTAIVSSIAIGIGVDYSIHFITWYRNELRRKPDIDAALENSIVHKGRAILYNMLIIVGGFIVLVFSNFVPLIQFGALVAVCMIVTAVGALVLVPAIIRVLAKRDPKFLYLGTKT